MQIAIAVMVILWWVSIWGLLELLIEGWGRQQKLIFFMSILVVISTILFYFPHIMDRL